MQKLKITMNREHLTEIKSAKCVSKFYYYLTNLPKNAYPGIKEHILLHYPHFILKQFYLIVLMQSAVL